jgi:hypothetical protein
MHESQTTIRPSIGKTRKNSLDDLYEGITAMTTHPKREYTPENIDLVVAFLRKLAKEIEHPIIREPIIKAADMLESLASSRVAQKRDGDEAWKPIETAPKDRHILLYGEVDGGNRSCDKTLVSAIWVSGGEPSDIFGEEGGWMVSFTDDCIAAVVDPTHWREKPLPPSPDQDSEVSL